MRLNRPIRCSAIFPLLRGFKATSVETGTYAQFNVGAGDFPKIDAASDAAEADSTAVTINATAHSVLLGDRIKFTSGSLKGQSRAVESTTANSITVDDPFSDPPTTGDTFSIQRRCVRSSAGKVKGVYDRQGPSGFIVGSAGADVQDGGYAVYDTDFDGSDVYLKTLNNTGAADDGTMYGLSLGFDAKEIFYTDKPKQQVKSSFYQPRLLAASIADDGTVNIGSSELSVSVASSVYTISFPGAFQAAPVIVAIPIGNSGDESIQVTSVSVESCEISTFDDGNASDLPFQFIALGSYSPNASIGGRNLVLTDQDRVRLEAFQITVDGSTPSINRQTCPATITDNGVGDYTLTVTEAGLRDMVAVATAKDHRVRLYSAPDEDDIRVAVTDPSKQGAAVEDDVNIIAILFDSEEAY